MTKNDDDNNNNKKSGDADAAPSWLFHAIVEHIPNMIFVKDAQRLAFTHFNRAGETLLGVARADLLGKDDFDLFPKADAEFFQAKDRETLKNNVLVDIPEEPLKTGAGTRWLHTRKVPLVDPVTGEPRYLLGISEDITEQKGAAEKLRAAKSEAEAASTELEAFAYSVAHDLRAPLRGIDGYSQALLEDYGAQLDAEGQRYLRNVRVAAQQMAHLIDDLLLLSRVTRGELDREPIDLTALANAIVTRIRKGDPKRADHVDVVIAEGLHATADARLVGVLLDNLIENAWKFTSALTSGATIEIGMAPAATNANPNAPPVFFVRDNGAGFDMKFKDKLFGPFQRLHGANEFPGTGIGLATAQRIVKRLGGHISADAKVGSGATFSFTLSAAE